MGFRPIAFGSSCTGDLSGFALNLREQSEQVSMTIDNGFNFKDTSSFRVLHQIEPPEVLDCIDDIIANHEFYDLILCWHTRILKECQNAKLFLHGKCTWMEFNYKPWLDTHKPMEMECDETKKAFRASFLTSSKNSAPGQVFRQQIYAGLPSVVGNIEIDKVKSPPYIPDKRSVLDKYQFTITPQNAYHENWFDDKIVDALVAKTIPLYWGCPNIGEYFNMDGIIHFQTYEELLSRLKELTPEYYAQHYKAVQDNFYRAMGMVHIWHHVDEAIADGIERKKAGGWHHRDLEDRIVPTVHGTTRPARRLRRPL
jgi:hypothetical protein